MARLLRLLRILAIGLRFLIRAILTLTGHLSADPDEIHKEDIRGADNHDTPAPGGEGV